VADDDEEVDGADARQRAGAAPGGGERLADADRGHRADRAAIAADAGADVGGGEHADDLVEAVGGGDLGQVDVGVRARVVVGDLKVEPVPGARQPAAEHRARQAAVRGGQRGEERVVGPGEPHGASSSK
jgi:hypothetical protein